MSEKVKMRSQETLNEEISEIFLKIKKWVGKKNFSNHDKMYISSLVGAEMIGAAMIAVSEEMIGQYLDQIIDMIKTKVKSRHEAFKVIKDECQQIFKEGE